MSNDSISDRDDAVGAPFDQTNGLAQGLEGDSDGTADSDVASEADRDDLSTGSEDDGLTDPNIAQDRNA